MTKPNGLGILAIIIFLSAFIIPIIYIFYTNLYKTIGLLYLILIIISNLLFITLLIYSYIKCMKKNVCEHNNSLQIKMLDDEINLQGETTKGFYNEDLAVYNLFTYGGWKHFQVWLAATSPNAWQNILFTIIMVLIPFPVASGTPIEKLYMMFARLGLFKLIFTIILGNPIYIVHKDNQYNESNTEGKIEIIVSILLIVILIIMVAFELIIKKQIFKTFFK